MKILLFNDSLNARLSTLIKNVKTKSNSFYDSYLDLLEATVKYFIIDNDIPYDDTRTCGHIIKTGEVKTFLKEELKLDDYTFDKLLDYIKKCNDHKHKSEKNLQLESVLNYSKVYFDFVNYYLDYTKSTRIEYDSNYFSSIFGETEKLNEQYKKELSEIKEELRDAYETNKLSEQDIEKYKKIILTKETELLNLDEQNQQLQEQISILKDIKLNSMENKLNRALELLVNLNDEIIINKMATGIIYKTITGGDIQNAIEKMNRGKDNEE